MSRATNMAVRFAQLVAQVEPDPDNSLDRRIVNVARRIAQQLQAEGLADADLPAPKAPASAAGIPITRKRA